MRRLIVNADDLGYDPRIDEGILEAHRRGLVTSSTAMVTTPYAPAALAAAPASLGLGLHVVLDEGLGEGAARAEILRQLDRFATLRGGPPTHLDSHKHAHARPPVLAAFAGVAVARGLPVRAISSAMRLALRGLGVVTADAFLGDADRRPAWTEDELAAALQALPDGLTELMAHPGYRPRYARTTFGAEREVELAALTSPRVRQLVTELGILLCSYADIGP